VCQPAGGDPVMYLLYDLVLLTSLLLSSPYWAAQYLLRGKYRSSLLPKLGFTPDSFFADLEGTPRVWIHAVSVGEVTAAAPIVAALRRKIPGGCLVVSTGTETGREMASRLIPEADGLFYYPLDLPWIVRKTLDRLRPDCFALTETELWPNLLRECRRRGVAAVMVNGRISPRSFSRYRATRVFWRRVLGNVAAAGVISPTDRDRLASMGMDPGKISVLGNAKFDGLAAKVSPGIRGETAALMRVAPGDPVLVAGSTHEGEEEAVLDVYGRVLADRPDCLLILVPRHVHRAEDVLALARRKGFDDAVAFSRLLGRGRRGERVVVVDVIGELFKVYSLASVVFCGGSLVKRGGQNILEAAAWGKVVLYGPSMEDFQQEKALLEEAGAGRTVRDAEELYGAVRSALLSPDETRRRGEAARAAVAANGGAAERYADLILSRLGRP